MTAPKQNKDALGKGIRSLLQNINNDLKNTEGALKPQAVEAATGVLRLPLENIETNPKQPRKDFDDTAMQELAQSIKLHDIIQPITVSKLHGNKYQLISGERRWRASKLAGLKDIPAFVRQANDHELLELALLENLQREDLNAMEIALSYKRMMDELSHTQEQVAERMGKDRSTVTNYIRLLRLPPDIQIAVRNGEISMGHARALINVDTIDKQLYIFDEIKTKGLSVRQTETLVRNIYKEKEERTNVEALPPAYKKVEDKLSSHFGTKVKLRHSKDGSGAVTFEYFSLEEMNKLLDLMNVTID
ncbi:MAG TPA: ParB/RepB/Spo0J family partition protein [Flavisolibacter sp.]|jgi:ParB family chromosome partitioning protein|nr:ParB/RepB/Spo0J family partition protein [Flavisolibacter sp.]